MKVIRKSKWYGIDVCIACKNILTDSEKMYSGGVCPKCGHEELGTICDTVKVIVRKVKYYPWWQLLNREMSYEGKNEFSKQWIKDHE
jgi:predicted RNA-binding Zn-ribbon protein involved in translation (DUF1610 family)